MTRISTSRQGFRYISEYFDASIGDKRNAGIFANRGRSREWLLPEAWGPQ